MAVRVYQTSKTKAEILAFKNRGKSNKNPYNCCHGVLIYVSVFILTTEGSRKSSFYFWASPNVILFFPAKKEKKKIVDSTSDKDTRRWLANTPHEQRNTNDLKIDFSISQVFCKQPRHLVQRSLLQVELVTLPEKWMGTIMKNNWIT